MRIFYPIRYIQFQNLSIIVLTGSVSFFYESIKPFEYGVDEAN